MTEGVTTQAGGIPRVEPPKSGISLHDGPVKAITRAVEATTGVKGFLEAAEITLVAYSDNITEKIGVEAVRVASDRGASAVDTPDIAEADGKLFPQNKEGQSPWKWGLIGIVAGAALSFLITILAPKISDDFRVLAISIGAVLLIGCLIWGLYLVSKSKKE